MGVSLRATFVALAFALGKVQPFCFLVLEVRVALRFDLVAYFAVHDSDGVATLPRDVCEAHALVQHLQPSLPLLLRQRDLRDSRPPMLPVLVPHHLHIVSTTGYPDPTKSTAP